MSEYTCTYSIPTLPLTPNIENITILKKVATARAALAELNGIMKLIPKPDIITNTLTLHEAKDSSAIENIITTHDELYTADIDNVSIGLATKEVQDYKKALLEWYEHVKTHKTLIINHIRSIQQNIENNTAWIRNWPGTILKNDQTWKVVYVPPQNHSDILNYLGNLETYINSPSDEDPLVKLAIIHHQFESIHPFYDGNGRTGRIINVLYLIMTQLLDVPVLYLSSYIIQHKSRYYQLLQHVRDTWEREPRVMYMLDAIQQTSLATTSMIKSIWQSMWQTKRIMKEKTSFYSKDFIELLYRHPYTKIDFIIQELWVTRKTASKYLNELASLWILEIYKKGRTKYYINKNLYRICTKWLIREQ